MSSNLFQVNRGFAILALPQSWRIWRVTLKSNFLEAELNCESIKTSCESRFYSPHFHLFLPEAEAAKPQANATVVQQVKAATRAVQPPPKTRNFLSNSLQCDSHDHGHCRVYCHHNVSSYYNDVNCKMSLLMFLLLWLFMLVSLLVLVAVAIASVLVIVALHNRRIFLMFGLRLSVGSTCHRCNTSIIDDGFSKSTGYGFIFL